MACCYTEDCGEYTSVAPMLATPCYPTKYCEDSPAYPCLPRCTKEAVYCCERKPQRSPTRLVCYEEQECCDPPPCRECSPPRRTRYLTSQCRTYADDRHYCPTCCQPTCKPVKTKYVIPCYRYEDGRIERYVPTRHGRLPMSAYRRNGMQDQIHGYRGAQRYLCAGQGPTGCIVYTAVEPMQRLYPKVTQEMLPQNQPTVLMRRACEVAIGTRARKKPFVVSSFSADQTGEVRRYHSEDERGNCCFHFERKKPCLSTSSCNALPDIHYLHSHDLHGHHMMHFGHSSQPCRPRQPCTSNPGCQFVDCVQAKASKSPKTCCYYT